MFLIKKSLVKSLFSVAVFIIAMQNSFSQTYSVSPNDTIEKYGVFEDLETLTIGQINSSANAITIKWAKVSESLPLLWEASVCDNSTCNTTLVDTGTMTPILPLDSGFLLLHITPHINAGTAVIRYKVWDVNYPSLIDTLTYLLHVNPTAINSIKSTSPLLFFSNHEIIISGIDEGIKKYFINDINGRVIQTSNNVISNARQNISVENFANGIYVFHCVTESNKTFQTKYLIQ